MTYMFEITTKPKAPQPRMPAPAQHPGIFGTADIGRSLGHSPAFFESLEGILSDQWKNLAKSEGHSKRHPAPKSNAFKHGAAEFVYEAIRGKGWVLAVDIAVDVPLSTDQVSAALQSLLRAGIVESKGRRPKKLWRYVGGVPKAQGRPTQRAINIDRAIDYLKENGLTQRETLRKALGLTDAQVASVLDKLRERDLARWTRKGHGQVPHWYLIDAAS